MSDLGIPQRFIDLAKQARGPRALSEAGLLERFGEPTDVEIEPGQMWQAHWDQVTVLVLILAVEDREIQAAPVTIDPPAEDSNALVVDGVSTVFGVNSTVWVGLAGAIPTRVLGRVVDAWSDQLVRWIRDAAQAQRQPGRVPVGARLGHEIASELDSMATFRAELADDLELLRQAPGLPVEISGVVPTDLASMLGDKLDLESLCSSLGLRQPEVMKLLRGKSPLTPDQIGVVARVTGLSAEEVARTVRPLPHGLVVKMEHPRWRPTWIHRARRLHVSESQARLSASYGAFAQAMRETGLGEPDWDERLRQFLREEERGSGRA